MTTKEQMISDLKENGFIVRKDYSNISDNAFRARKSEAQECIRYMDEGRVEACKQWEIVFEHLDEDLSKAKARSLFYFLLASIASLMSLIISLYK